MYGIINYVEVLAESELTQCTKTEEFLQFFLRADRLGTPDNIGGVLFFSGTKRKQKGRVFICILKLGMDFARVIGRSALT